MPLHTTHRLSLPGGRELVLGGAPVVMGILNVTPDSFSDGGSHDAVDAARAHARLMVSEGADVIDVGGESTRPGAEPVAVQAELDRVMPVLDALAADQLPVPVSIDTYKALVADQALQAGASIINDVHGLQREPEIADVAALHGVPVIAMHWDLARDSGRDLVSEMIRFLEKSIQIAEHAGLSRNRIIIDPGFGFAKSLDENYELLRRLDELHVLGCPILAGTSRKSMIGRLLDRPADQRLAGTIATSVIAYCAGAHIFRVHDVGANRDALRVAQASLYGRPRPRADMSKDFSGDRIILRDLGFYGYHGLMSEENRLGQRFFVDLTCGVDLSAPGRTDLVGETISYAEIYDVVKLAFETRCKLIEAVGENIADALFAHFAPIRWVIIRVRKPEAPIAMVTGEAAIELHRHRDDR